MKQKQGPAPAVIKYLKRSTNEPSSRTNIRRLPPSKNISGQGEVANFDNLGAKARDAMKMSNKGRNSKMLIQDEQGNQNSTLKTIEMETHQSNRSDSSLKMAIGSKKPPVRSR